MASEKITPSSFSQRAQPSEYVFDKILDTLGEDVPDLSCRVHLNQPLKHICLDQFCDYQRLICEECESTEHYYRHRHRCILVSQLYEKADVSLTMKNWPQDEYLRHFQEYLIGQTTMYDDRIKEMCKKLQQFLAKKLEEIQNLLLRISTEEQTKNSESNQILKTDYQTSCSNFNGLRKILEDLARKSANVTDQRFRSLQIEKEKAISLLIKDQIKQVKSYKKHLNETFGFAYFESTPLVPSIIDFNLVQHEFDAIRSHICEVTTYIEKNVYLSLSDNSKYSRSNNNDRGQNGRSQSQKLSPFDEEGSSLSKLKLTTAPSEKNYVAFNADYQQAFFRNSITQPTYFYSNIIPQQAIFQLRVTGELMCGMYIGMIDDDSKTVPIVRDDQRQSHFVGACVGCKHDVVGKCKTQGTGLNFAESQMDEQQYSPYDNESYSDYEEHGIERKRTEMKSVIIEIFINLKKKMITITDSAKESYIQFDLDNKNYFYNKNLRLFVQSAQQLQVEVLDFNYVK